MKKFDVVLSEDAENDIKSYIEFIMYEYSSPLTALRHYQGLFDTIFSLEKIADKISISHNHSLQQFGFNTRRVNYKKMTIIYTIHNKVVFIKRIVAQSIIAEL